MTSEPWCDSQDDERELLGLWLSRLMFGGLVTPELQPFCVETRTAEEFLTAHSNSHE